MNLYESGIRNRRTEFVPESTVGVPPSDPSWELFSDRMINFEASPEVQYAVDQAIGDPDPAGIERGPEDHELVVAYRLQRWIVDGSGNAQDASGYGIVRQSDNELQTHTIVDREDRVSGGNDGAGVRIYTVALGAMVGTVSITLDADTGEPVPVELNYTCEKIRSYAIHQPSSSTTVEIVSTDAGDTMDIEIEGQDSGSDVSETISLNGTTTVTTTQSFESIDAAYLASEPAGDVTISDGSGTTLMTIRGADSYDGIEGDRGVPTTGSGSHASALGSSFEKFLGDSIDRGGSAIAGEIVSGEIEVDNGLETTPRASTYRRVVTAGQRSVTMSADLIGEVRSHDAWDDHLQNTQSDVVWNAGGGTVTLNSATLTTPGARAITPDEILLQDGSEFTAQGITVA